MIADLTGKTALVTGGTMGIGLATALALAQHGAQCTLTYKWGTADVSEVLARFEQAGAPAPRIIQADASVNEDTDRLLDQMRGQADRVDILISNVSAALLIGKLQDYSLRSLMKTIQYSAWPMYEYTERIHSCFGSYPRYVIGMSSSGPDSFSKGYDFMGMSKAVLETMCRYMSHRLYQQDVHINIVRSQAVRTQSMRETFSGFEDFAKQFMDEKHFVDAGEVANVIVALCSGFLDGMRGQVINVDRGISQFDNLIHFFSHESGS